MHHVIRCPVCQEGDFSYFLSCEDYTVSHETFQLLKCQGCDLVMTSPQPDEEEIGNYYLSDAYISHSDKSPGLISGIYKLSRKFTLQWKLNLIRQYSATGEAELTLLDFGCGTGAFLRGCEKNKIKITGVEPSAVARSHATKNTRGKIYKDINEVNDDFNVITLWHVLEHVEKLNDTVAKLRSQLKKNGTMFIAVPNLQSPDARKYQRYWAGYDVPRHLWHFSRKTMELLLKQHGLSVSSVVPMKLDAYYVSLLSEKYKNQKHSFSGMARAIAEGWRSNHAARRTTEFSSLIYIART